MSLVLVSCFMIGCAQVDASQWQAKTVTYSGAELDRQIVRTSHFQHVLFSNRVVRSSSQAVVWVFVEGDGNAWLRDGRAAEDPTPIDPLALRLMTETSGPAIYVGRPCAFGTLTSDPQCTASVWTVDRYSPRVVESLLAAVRARLPADARPVLVGYSGGGVLALQLAQRLRRSVGVVTVAANLDVAAWASHHGYTEQLTARAAPLELPRRDLLQLHLFGGRDTNAPYELAADLLAQDPNAHVRVFEQADHDCCWVQLWPEIMQEFQQLMDAAVLMRSNSSLR